MLNLSEFVSKSVFESSEKISPNTEDIKVLYDKFNEMYFDNKLPKNVDVAAKKIRSSRLGEQGYHLEFGWKMENTLCLVKNLV